MLSSINELGRCPFPFRCSVVFPNFLFHTLSKIAVSFFLISSVWDFSSWAFFFSFAVSFCHERAPSSILFLISVIRPVVISSYSTSTPLAFAARASFFRKFSIIFENFSRTELWVTLKTGSLISIKLSTIFGQALSQARSLPILLRLIHKNGGINVG